jgi:hypothetical protein
MAGCGAVPDPVTNMKMRPLTHAFVVYLYIVGGFSVDGTVERMFQQPFRQFSLCKDDERDVHWHRLP